MEDLNLESKSYTEINICKKLPNYLETHDKF